MKIIHFSDVHAGSWPSSLKDVFSKKIIGSLNYNFGRKKHVFWENFEELVSYIKDEKIEVVVFTGDLTSISDKKEFDFAIEKLSVLVENKAITFLAIPGNHDLYVKNTFDLANEAYTYLNQNKFSLNDFPCHYTIENITFHLLNQACAQPLMKSQGKVLLNDISSIRENIAKFNTNKHILLGHYPCKNAAFNNLKEHHSLINAEEIYQLLSQGVIDYYLCGHIHRHFMLEIAGSYQICSGSLTMGGYANLLKVDKDIINQEWIKLKGSIGTST